MIKRISVFFCIYVLIMSNNVYAVSLQDIQKNWIFDSRPEYNQQEKDVITIRFDEGSKPEDNITVEKFTRLIFEAVGKQYDSEGVINTAKKDGIIQNGEYESYNEKFITQGEMARIISRTLNLDTVDNNAGFINAYEIPEELRAHICTAVENGIIDWEADGSFKAYKYTTKAQVYAVLKRIISYCNKRGLNKKEGQSYSEGLIKSSVVYAQVIRNSPLYSNKYYSGTVGSINYGDTVEVIRDSNYQWYYIEKEDSEKGWVPAEVLSIPPDPETNMNRLCEEQLEEEVAHKGLISETDCLVWVDIDRQLTYIFKESDEGWKHFKTFECSTGLNISPTLRGTFKAQERGRWFYSQRFRSGAVNWVRYSGDYLFHSVAMDINRNIVDNTLGKRASAGCVRLSVEDSKWFYECVPMGSTIYID